MSEQQRQTETNRLAPEGYRTWNEYWMKEHNQPWRTEPEIDGVRQAYLAERRAIIPDVEQDIYPFKDIEPKLSRADVEWLLATHQEGRGPEEYSDDVSDTRRGLDVRGADLKGINLRKLPLVRLYAGLVSEERDSATRQLAQNGKRQPHQCKELACMPPT